MVKTLNINVSYNNQKRVIVANHQEIANKISSCFGINLKDFILYDKDGNREVSPDDINDYMKIQIVPKRNGQQNLHAYIDVDPASNKIVDDIISKLHRNSPLSGEERKLLIEALKTDSSIIFTKRKSGDADINQPTQKKKTSNKKTQVNISATNVKESFAQTDPFKFPENHANNNDDAIQSLKRLWNLEDKPHEEIDNLMKETFNDRRSFIYVKCPSVSAVKELYPSLFCVEQVKNELDRIFYPGKYLEFLDNMQKYSTYILHYAKDVNSDDVREKTKQAVANARTPLQKTYAKVVGSIFGLAKLLEENFGFIHLSDYPHGSGNVYPYIDASCHSLQNIFFDDIFFEIIVEGQHFCDASNFPEAILCLVASFFIFNIDYPESYRRTLIVLEKLYLKGNDTINVDDLTGQMIKILRAKEDEAKRKISK